MFRRVLSATNKIRPVLRPVQVVQPRKVTVASTKISKPLPTERKSVKQLPVWPKSLKNNVQQTRRYNSRFQMAYFLVAITAAADDDDYDGDCLPYNRCRKVRKFADVDDAWKLSDVDDADDEDDDDLIDDGGPSYARTLY